MKLVVQRVSSAHVQKVSTGQLVGKIGKGLFCLVGFKKGDTEGEVARIAEKLSKLRIMGDDQDKMNLSTLDAKTNILVVSQFTLYADTSGGNRPSFIEAEEPEKAKKLYEFFVNELRSKDIKVETGSFGDYMSINAVLDGPVTIIY